MEKGDGGGGEREREINVLTVFKPTMFISTISTFFYLFFLFYIK